MDYWFQPRRGCGAGMAAAQLAARWLLPPSVLIQCRRKASGRRRRLRAESIPPKSAAEAALWLPKSNSRRSGSCRKLTLAVHRRKPPKTRAAELLQSNES